MRLSFVISLPLVLSIALGICPSLQGSLILEKIAPATRSVGPDEVKAGASKELRAALEAYNRGDFETAAKQAQGAATREEAAAQFLLGLLYEKGQGLEASQNSAKAWYVKAAKQGSSVAKLNLGLLGIQAVADEESGAKIEDAIQWFDEAFEAGDPRGALYLAEIYHYGVGTSKDLSKAFKQYQKAAEKGSAEGANMAGLFLIEGKEIEKDPEKAFKYFEQAATGGLAAGMVNVSNCYENGFGVEKSPPEASAWLLKAGRNGTPGVLTELGKRYINGEGFLKDEVAGAAWLERAARAGDATAQFLLAQLYFSGHVVIRNEKAALKLFTLASNNGHLEARFSLAQMLAQGVGLEESKPMLGDAHGLATSAGRYSLEAAKAFATSLEATMTEQDFKTSEELVEKLEINDQKRREPK